MSESESLEGVKETFPSVPFDTRAAFETQLLLALNSAQREIWLADEDFSRWPLNGTAAQSQQPNSTADGKKRAPDATGAALHPPRQALRACHFVAQGTGTITHPICRRLQLLYRRPGTDGAQVSS